jgi:hypothetical protein
MKRGIAILSALVLISGTAIAGNDYRCTIERLSLAGGDSGAVYDLHKNNYVGKQFTVERTSGMMAGALKNSYVTKPQVIDMGSKENSFKAVTTMRVDQGTGAGSNVYALNVLEYEQGKMKPFVFLNNEMVFFGHCEHFKPLRPTKPVGSISRKA